MSEKFLYEELDIFIKYNHDLQLPRIIENGLSKKIALREYQINAFKNFITYFENKDFKKNKQIHNLFHMATGSGKTVIMAGLILYLYEKGYRSFLFFVNQTNVLEKTIDNFINPHSSKYLFNNVIEHLGNKIKIKKVNNFSGNNENDIEIVFTTTQKLHADLSEPKENSLTYEDFEDNKVVFISDESHHVNSLTKKPTKNEKLAASSWEFSVTNAFACNKDSIMLEFTATCDLKDKNVLAKYKDKIVFNYPLVSFRESGYTKDFQNFATNSDLWTRTLIALVMSEYRKYLFADLKLNIKPVVLLKSNKISASIDFYNEFFRNLKMLSIDSLTKLEDLNFEALKDAIQYFKNKNVSPGRDKDVSSNKDKIEFENNESLKFLLQSIKQSFTEETSIIINGSSDNNREKQLLLNSLEDSDNPIRVIFTVDMLNEGWDVLNLFDIVRLYDTRQGSGKAGKIGSYTIKEAQLIGRGARYCPFVDDDEDFKFKRKYDGDLTNPKRILETMFFHSKYDSSYIAELKQALIETGLQAPKPIVLEYKLKQAFEETDFYKNTYVYSNKRFPVERENVHSIEASMKNKIYHYTVLSGKGFIHNLIGNDDNNKVSLKTTTASFKFKEIDLNILLGAHECFEELRFDLLKQKYPTLSSTIEFLTSDEFLGNSVLVITYSTKELLGKDIFLGVKSVLEKVVSHVTSLKPAYKGSTKFSPVMLKNVIKNKKIYLEKIDNNGGKGYSQNHCIKEEYKLNLEEENWYVYNDNFGTSEEKLFLKYFKETIASKLEKKNLEFYIIRNERIPDLAIYSFESGERFEPDFLLFVKKKNNEGSLIYQGYVEPKGEHLLKQDSWKEAFLLDIANKYQVDKKLSNEYKIFGFPFFNSKKKIKEFEDAIENWLKKI